MARERNFTTNKSLIISILTILLLISNAIASRAGNIKGSIVDAETKEPLIGAIVHLKELNISTTTNLEGVYEFKSIPSGNYTIQCKYLGYVALEKTVLVSDEPVNAILDFSMATTLSQEVIVSGKSNPESDLSARQSEQKSDNTMNIMSSQAIQLLPDLTIGNTLQRISGVTVERNSSGDGQYAIVRGMDKRYNYTLINGIKIPTPDNKNRYVPLDLFPSDIVERIEVYKTLLPSMEADAIGGAINLQLRSAPDYLYIRGTVAGGYNQILGSQPFVSYNANPISIKSPGQVHGSDYAAQISDFSKSTFDYFNVNAPVNTLANLIIGNRFLDHKLGVLFTGSYQNLYKGTNSLFFHNSSQPVVTNPDGTYTTTGLNRGNVPQFDFVEALKYSTQQTRYAAHVKLDYQFNNLNSISFYTLYVQTRQQQVRTANDTATAVNLGLLNHEYRSSLTLQSIYNATLQGNHILLPGLKLDWSATYAIASNNQPDFSTLTTEDNYYTHTPPYTYILSLSRKWISNTDQDIAGYANLTYNIKVAGSDLEVKAGGMDRHKDRNNYYADYTESPVPPPGQNQQQYTTFDKAVFDWIPAGDALGKNNTSNSNTYVATEDVSAGYGQVKYVFFNKLQVIGGARIENTSEYYNELMFTESTPEKTGNKSYYDVLPGIHLKYMINEKMNLRLSYYESLTRPSLFEITPYKISGDAYDEAGNPFLKHVTADNYDLRYELFPNPKSIDQVLLGVFYKNIYNPIQYAFARVNTSGLELQPQNFGTATNYGVEAVITKFIGNFGINANYTYTNSSITSKKAIYYNNGSKLVTDTVLQTTPLQGQAAHIGNLSLIYKNTKKGVDVQVSFIYTGRHIEYVSAYYGLDYWLRPNLQLDLSAEKTFGKKKNFSVYVKLNNLLNTPTIAEIDKPNVFQNAKFPYFLPSQDSPNNIKVQQDYYGQSYLAGIRYKF